MGTNERKLAIHTQDRVELQIMHNTGMHDDETFTSFAALNKIGAEADRQAKGLGLYVDPELRRFTWESVDDQLKTVIAAGSIARYLWWRGDNHQPRSLLYFRDSDELQHFDDDSYVGLFTNALRGTLDYCNEKPKVPSPVIPWAIELYKVVGDDEKKTIRSGIVRASFVHNGIDSEDSGTPHPVDDFLNDPDLDDEIRLQLIFSAHRDVAESGFKGNIWMKMFDVAMQRLAKKPEDALRFEARKLLGLPISDELFNEHQTAIQKDFDDHRQATQDAWTERSEMAKERIKTFITELCLEESSA